MVFVDIFLPSPICDNGEYGLPRDSPGGSVSSKLVYSSNLSSLSLFVYWMISALFLYAIMSSILF